MSQETQQDRPIAEMPFRHALIVANPISGRGKAEQAARELADGLRGRGTSTELFVTGGAGDAFTRLRTLEADTDLVVAVGGDGTISEVFRGLVDPQTPVGILPFGTANVLAEQLRLPRDVHHALEILSRGRVIPIDVARVNGRMCFLVTGVGLDALAVRDVHERRRGPITKWTYVLAVLRQLRRYTAPRLVVEVDGRRLDGEYGLVLVCNLLHYGGLLRLAEDTLLDDGQVETYLFPTGGFVDLASGFLRGFFGRLPGGRVAMVRGRRVRVTSEAPVPYQVDGDPGGDTPVDLEVGPNQYHLIVP